MKKPVVDKDYEYKSAFLKQWCQKCDWMRDDLRSELKSCPECRGELSQSCILKFGSGEIQFRAGKECFDISSGKSGYDAGQVYAPDITDVTVFILRHLTWWRGEENNHKKHQKARLTDRELLGQLYDYLSIQERTNFLRAYIKELIRTNILKPDSKRSHEEEEDLIHNEIEDRLRCCYSLNSFAQELLSIARDKFFDFEETIFPDGLIEEILVCEAQIPVYGDFILSKYIDFIEMHSEYELPHPSDFSYRIPEPVDWQQERERHVEDFSCMVREWRGEFIQKLLADCSKPRDLDRL